MEYVIRDPHKGDTVQVTGYTPYGEVSNCKGVILRHGLFHDWIVDVEFPDGSHDELGYDTPEISIVSEAAE